MYQKVINARTIAAMANRIVSTTRPIQTASNSPTSEMMEDDLRAIRFTPMD